ncbi:hypothetical protein [Methylocaldum sp.]|uniref:hypothetical protein n=1 Tax=Methylocaldum sp. TaxID=1969727 RepID=UPI002D2C7E47|nr:hypothetical protein [Methylocaldum sp.]HYE35483.1 hypothetical protein [Methylocaldum sp.]
MKKNIIDKNRNLARAMRLAADAAEDLAARGIEVMTVSCLGRLPVLTLNWSPACRKLGGEWIGRGGNGVERYVLRSAPYHGCKVQWREPDNRARPATGFLGLGQLRANP